MKTSPPSCSQDDRPQSQYTPSPYASGPGAHYLLPCPILGLGGLYEWCLVSVEQARRWVTSAPYVNYLTHPFLRQACEALLDVSLVVPTWGSLPTMGYHDDVLVFSVAGYDVPWALWRGDLKQVRQALDEGAWTLGFLKRLA